MTLLKFFKQSRGDLEQMDRAQTHKFNPTLSCMNFDFLLGKQGQPGESGNPLVPETLCLHVGTVSQQEILRVITFDEVVAASVKNAQHSQIRFHKPITSDAYQMNLLEWNCLRKLEPNPMGVLYPAVVLSDKSADWPIFQLDNWDAYFVQSSPSALYSAFLLLDKLERDQSCAESSEVEAFIRMTEHLSEALDAASALVRRHFSGCRLEKSVYRDPEEPELSWLRLEIFITIDRERARRNLDKLETEWCGSDDWHPALTISLGV